MRTRLINRNFPRGSSPWDRPNGLEDSLQTIEDFLSGWVVSVGYGAPDDQLANGAWHLRLDNGFAYKGSVNPAGNPINIVYTAGELKGMILPSEDSKTIWISNGVIWFSRNLDQEQLLAQDLVGFDMSNNTSYDVSLNQASPAVSFGDWLTNGFLFNSLAGNRLFFVRMSASLRVDVSGATQVALAFGAAKNANSAFPTINSEAHHALPGVSGTVHTNTISGYMRFAGGDTLIPRAYGWSNSNLVQLRMLSMSLEITEV